VLNKVPRVWPAQSIGAPIPHGWGPKVGGSAAQINAFKSGAMIGAVTAGSDRCRPEHGQLAVRVIVGMPVEKAIDTGSSRCDMRIIDDPEIAASLYNALAAKNAQWPDHGRSARWAIRCRRAPSPPSGPAGGTSCRDRARQPARH